MARRSAGLLLHRGAGDTLEVLLVHPGGPFWARKDAGAWSIPKGEHGDDEEPLAAALREFEEELGVAPPAGAAEEALPLGEARQKGGKLVAAWAVAGDLDPARIVSDSFEIEWPPRSGRRRAFPEVDRAGWFTLDQAREKLLPGQLPLLERFAESRERP
jgi:predicted NUDIX family NTP pyrophosphohydrolase